MDSFSIRSWYDTDLTDAQWQRIKGFIPRAKCGGRKRHTDVRRVMDGILYFVTHGCKWRGLPKDFPPWQTVYGYFQMLREKGKWKAIHFALYEEARKGSGRNVQPSLLLVDSQSVKTGKNAAASTRGYDGGKRIKGRKRHAVTDSLGLLVDIAVTPANVNDVNGAEKVLAKIRQRWKNHRVEKVVADKGYRGDRFGKFMRTKFGANVEIGENHTSPRLGFVPAQKRWVVERGFAWFGDCWRLSVDRERLLKNSTTMLRIAFMRLMLRRLYPC
ncbi:IS5 family transposase [Acetobacteraceae bacterium KSS8]|uniref:IS5 family transposase n=1 Tax=Endosaccharibacter trunci TaxID=2812733 RepID=A0ABT1WAJ3_9PROT|nr:IS5 family transposase [Acetobacteraceae bacterium KSS8]